MLLFWSAVSYADVTIVQKVTTGAMKGRPAGDSIVKMMVKGKRARIETEGKTGYQILDLEKNTVFMIDPDSRQAMTMSLDSMTAAKGLMEGMMKNSNSNVQKTGKKQKISGYNCEEYSVVISGGMLKIDSVQWITKDVDTSELENFQSFTRGMMKVMGTEDLSQIQGLPVRTQSNIEMAGQKVQSNSELIHVSMESLSESLFLVPPGYEISPMESILKE